MKTIYGHRRCFYCKETIFNGIALKTTYMRRNKYYCNKFCYESINKYNNLEKDLKDNIIEFVKIKS